MSYTGIREDWVNVARTHELSQLRTAFTVILPAAAPIISMDIDKEENPKGDRVVLTMNGKFLPYKVW